MSPVKKEIATPASDLFGDQSAVPVVEPIEEEVEAPASMEEMRDAMELSLLKERAVQMGITFHPAIGTATLRAKVAAALNVVSTPTAQPVAPVTVVMAPVADPEDTRQAAENAKLERIAHLRRESFKLIRVVVSCMNPSKQLMEGDTFTVSNSVVGTAKKYVPFNIDVGYHIPNIIYEHLLERKCLIFYAVTDPRTKIKTNKTRLINEFNVVVLPPLTGEELKDLAMQQAANNSID